MGRRLRIDEEKKLKINDQDVIEGIRVRDTFMWSSSFDIHQISIGSANEYELL